jgi:hypothetical protein
MRIPLNLPSAVRLGLLALTIAGAWAGAQSEPTWPQPFTIAPGERTSFGFAAGSPGAVSITATWSGGANLTVSLRRTDGSVAAEKSGTGNVTLDYAITASDVAKGTGWAAGLKSNAPPGGSSNAVADQPFKTTTALINGQISVTHPPGDARSVKGPALKIPTMAHPSATSALVAQRTAARRALLGTQQSVAMTQAKGKLQSPKSDKAPQAAVGPTAADRAAAMRGGSGATPVQSGSPVASAGTTTGTPAAAVPVIVSLNVTQGEPGDPVLVTGKNFGDTPGQVHFIVSNNADIVPQGMAATWTDSQIIISVPDADGHADFNGFVYVTPKNGTKSAFVPFHFVAAIEYRTLALTNDAQVRGDVAPVPAGSACHEKGTDPYDFWASFSGHRGDDEYFLTTRLKNGWVVDAATLDDGKGGAIGIAGSGNASITEMRAGTDSPYLKVHWWFDGGSYIMFCPEIIIRGPKGVPNS